jgi:tRNA modification GTPase
MTETLVARLTPAGQAGMATIGVFGPEAWATVRPFFEPRGPLANDSVSEVLVGRFGTAVKDDVVIRFRAADDVEIHCHGGPAVIQMVLELLERGGARRSDWRIWLSHTEPKRYAEALALCQAPTLRTANLLLNQYHLSIQPDLTADAAWAEFGRHLTEPWLVVLAGPPNAGKSTLLNALVGYQRAITAEVPGTTRDLVQVRTAFAGWPIELIDSAGLRKTESTLEAAGIDLTRQACVDADLILWIVEPTQPVDPPSDWDASKILRIVNKSDLAKEQVGPGIRVSAKTGAGLDDLVAKAVDRLVPHLPPAGTRIPIGGFTST